MKMNGANAIARNQNAWRSFNQDIELLYSMSLPRCVKYCQGKLTRRLFIAFNQRNHLLCGARSLVIQSTIFSNGNLEIRVDSKWKFARILMKSNGPHSIARKRTREKGDRGSYRVPVREIISRYFDARNAAKVCARTPYFAVYFHIYKRVSSTYLHASFAAMFN